MPKTSLADRYLQAWNSHDPAKILDFFYKDATYVDSGLNSQVSGRKVGNHVERIIRLCPDIEFELLDGGLTGNGRAAIQWRACGKNLGRLCPQLELGERDTLRGLDYIVHRNGQVLSTHVYFDLAPELEHPPTHHDLKHSGKHYRKSGLNDTDVAYYSAQLDQLMQQQQLYLSHDLTLGELAAQLNISSNHLSQVINQKFSLSFYDLLNHYRIEHAKMLLSNPDNHRQSTLELALDAGFGSVSTFYRAFGQQVKMSPSQYRKRLS
ncbi:MAG: helix-turn-helix domain-containing protein [Pseudomonadales bacterium]